MPVTSTSMCSAMVRRVLGLPEILMTGTIGNPIVPVIKISGNPKTLRTMAEHIDVDVTGILRRDQTLDTAGDALVDMIIRTANGRLTAAEALGHREFSLTKLYRSA